MKHRQCLVSLGAKHLTCSVPRRRIMVTGELRSPRSMFCTSAGARPMTSWPSTSIRPSPGRTCACVRVFDFRGPILGFGGVQHVIFLEEGKGLGGVRVVGADNLARGCGGPARSQGLDSQLATRAHSRGDDEANIGLSAPGEGFCRGGGLRKRNVSHSVAWDRVASRGGGGGGGSRRGRRGSTGDGSDSILLGD